MSVERQQMEVDIVCSGFGPATAGFLHTLNKNLMDEQGNILLESKVAPGMPLQVLCYERADDTSFGLSGVVTRAKAIRESLTDEEIQSIPMTVPVGHEEMLYMTDPHGKSRRSFLLKVADFFLKVFGWAVPFLYRKGSFKIPFISLIPFLNKKNGFVLSMGQFMQWVSSSVMSKGLIQIWPGMPVKEALIDGDKITGIRLVDQGVDKSGNPDAGFMPGMDIKAAFTVVGDGPVGPLGAQLNEKFGMPEGHHLRDWVVGMKTVVDLPDDSKLKPGTVIHTMGYPEPEIFGFLYAYDNKKASMGVFVPSWFDNPARNSYRYMQHWMQHPSIWQYIKGGKMSSWGAKSLQESGMRGEPYLVGDGYARIGEGSGTTNTLKMSGVDEAWKSGTLLAEAIIKLAKEKKDFTKENLEATYVADRKNSWLYKQNKKSMKARDGFQKGFVPGFVGMGVSGITGGLLNPMAKIRRPHDRVPSLESYFKGKIKPEELKEMKDNSYKNSTVLYNDVMDKLGWPAIEFDGTLLMSHQDALLTGGKVQAAPGFADHIIFKNMDICKSCEEKICIDICSAQAITPSEEGTPLFDREKCIHCGACMWNCSKADSNNPELTNIDFQAGSGGLHSAEN